MRIWLCPSSSESCVSCKRDVKMVDRSDGEALMKGIYCTVANGMTWIRKH